jgi:hypothetical protein
MKGNFVMLRAGALRLVLPQHDVGAARYIEAGNAGECIALSEGMSMLPARPPERFIAAEFTGEQAGVAWSWDELRVMIGAQFDPVPVPNALQAEGSPLRAYVEIDGNLAFLCSAEALCNYAMATVVA